MYFIINNQKSYLTNNFSIFVAQYYKPKIITSRFSSIFLHSTKSSCLLPTCKKQMIFSRNMLGVKINIIRLFITKYSITNPSFVGYKKEERVFKRRYRVDKKINLSWPWKKDTESDYFTVDYREVQRIPCT